MMLGDSVLIKNNKEAYGDFFSEHLFEQYKHYVESAEKISERRVTSNNFFLAANSFMLSLNGFPINEWCSLLVCIAGILVSLTWSAVVQSYKSLNSVKFQVIHELEKYMPAALYEYEWYKAEYGKGEAYKPTSHIERWVPKIFIFMYVVVILIKYRSLICNILCDTCQC